MRKIVAIGGVTPPLNLDLIDREIIKLSNKKNPRVLYVPTAGGDDLNYCEFFKGIYEVKFGCKLDILFLVRETPTEDEIRQKVFSSDIIYVEGGSVSRLMSCFKKYKIDKMIEEAYKRGIVIAGKSAGALCWGKYYFEDDDTNDFKTQDLNDYMEVECLKLLNFIICPHYNLEGYSEKMEAMIRAHNVVGIGLENDCAIELIDNNYRIITTNDNSNVYKVYKEGTRIQREIIIKDNNFRNINELIQVPCK